MIAFGSMVNNSLIEIGDRLRDISTFRVLGYKPNQVSGIFLRQNLIVFAGGMVLAAPIAYWLVLGIVSAYDTELFRMPVILRPRAFVWTGVIVIVFVFIAQVVVYRTIHKLDWLEGIKVKGIGASSMSKGWLILLVIIVLIVGGSVWNSMQPDATLQVIHPERQSIRAYVEEQGITELPHDYLISMPISGWLERITLREGDRVEANQVIARLEEHDLLDHVSQAEQRIAVLETNLNETADHRLEQNALVETEATVKAIDETVQAAEAKLEAAQATRDFTESEVQRLRKLFETGGCVGTRAA